MKSFNELHYYTYVQYYFAPLERTLVVGLLCYNGMLGQMAVLLVIRSGFYEDRQKFTLCRSLCPTQFFSSTR